MKALKTLARLNLRLKFSFQINPFFFCQPKEMLSFFSVTLVVPSVTDMLLLEGVAWASCESLHREEVRSSKAAACV